jgi:hypothetical protein
LGGDESITDLVVAVAEGAEVPHPEESKRDGPVADGFDVSGTTEGVAHGSTA